MLSFPGLCKKKKEVPQGLSLSEAKVSEFYDEMLTHTVALAHLNDGFRHIGHRKVDDALAGDDQHGIAPLAGSHGRGHPQKKHRQAHDNDAPCKTENRTDRAVFKGDFRSRQKP